MEHVIVAVFSVESETFQAFSKCKEHLGSSGYLISQMVIVKKINNTLKIQESFDTGIETQNDTIAGGLIGALVGVLGGPLGILLGGSIGSLIGSSFDMSDAKTNASMIEIVSHSLADGETAFIALVQEDEPLSFDNILKGFQNVSVTRWDAAVLQQEIETARMLEKELEKKARNELREKKTEERKQKIEEYRAKVKKDFADLKEKMKNRN